jgi:hypothetical protein
MTAAGAKYLQFAVVLLTPGYSGSFSYMPHQCQLVSLVFDFSIAGASLMIFNVVRDPS